MKLRQSKRWQMQHVKAKLSHVVKESQAKGPQIITVHGQDVAAIVAISDLAHVFAPPSKMDGKGEILAMLQRCPHPLSELYLERNKTPISSKSVFG